jgi:hypothetical protein
VSGAPAVRFLLHPSAGAIPEVAHTIGTVAALLELPWRMDGPGATGPLVYVGPLEAEPADAVVTIPVDGWPMWAPREVRVVTEPGGVRLVLGAGARPADTSPTRFPADWLRGLSHLLTREEEILEPHRDEWGCFAAPYSRAHELGVLDTPIVNLQAARLERAILSAWSGPAMTPVPRWKDGARFATVLSHDVDWITRYSLLHSWRLLGRSRMPGDYASRAALATAWTALRHGSSDRDPYWNFERWADEEARRGFRSTFYICPPASQAHPYDPTYLPSDPLRFRGQRTTVEGLFHRLRDEGFEVGLHGTYRSMGDAGEITRQRQAVDAMAGHAVTGTRQHFLRLDVRTAWDAHERAGLLHDSTLGYNEAVGFRAGIAAPFHPWSHGERRAYRLLELPLTAMDGALFRSLKLDGPLAARRVMSHLEGVAACGGLAVLLWHPNAADESAYPGWWTAYLEVLDDLAARGAWVVTAEELAAWWRERERRQRVDAAS